MAEDDEGDAERAKTIQALDVPILCDIRPSARTFDGDPGSRALSCAGNERHGGLEMS
jgi:hypothetical protein